MARKQAKNKLYRGQDAKIGGVCSGLAEYFDMDPTIMRILWVVGTFVMGGTGIIFYLICWLIIPQK